MRTMYSPTAKYVYSKAQSRWLSTTVGLLPISDCPSAPYLLYLFTQSRGLISQQFSSEDTFTFYFESSTAQPQYEYVP